MTMQIFVSILLVGAVLLQVKGQGGGLFGSSDGSFRTRRGLELASDMVEDPRKG